MEKGIGDGILSSKDVDNITGELGDVGDVALLPGGPRRRGAEQGVHQGFVVSEESELPTFQEKSEMTNGGVSCQKLSVKGGVFGLSGGKFLGEATERLLEDSTHMKVR